MEDHGVNLVGGSGDNEAIDLAKCIICQSSTQVVTTSGSTGRKRVRDAAEIRNDIVAKRLRNVGDDAFVYHMDNNCYKKYTLKKTLDAISANIHSKSNEDLQNDSSSHIWQSDILPRPGPCPEVNVYKLKCVICGHAKHQDTYNKFRISEMDRAKKFLEATVFCQDDVYIRTCDLQSESAVFGADLYCHKLCINKYLLKYERDATMRKIGEKPVSEKYKAWSNVITDIEEGIKEGRGYELSYVRDQLNNSMASDSKGVTNREVTILLMNYFGDTITFSKPKQVNKSALFFGKSVSAQNMAETIRGTDPIRQCAEILRHCLLEYDFQLDDRFCDSNDLKTSWESMQIPEPLVRFFAILYNFDVTSFNDMCSGIALEDDIETENEPDVGVSKSRCRQMQALFQTMFYILHGGRSRTPLHILNSQSIYDTCKSATLIKSFNRFGLCCSYDEVMRNHNDLAMFVIDSCENEVPFPSHFLGSQFTHAAMDNFDHEEATLSGIGGSHDTVTVLFQDDTDVQAAKPKVSETRINHDSKTFHFDLKCQERREFFKPARRADLPSSYVVPTRPIQANDALMHSVKVKDVAWLLARLDLERDPLYTIGTKPQTQQMPSWSAANSVFALDRSKQKRVAFLPVLPYPVTQFDTVYTAMKNLQSILYHLDQSVLPVTCDEGVYRIAREIQLIRPLEFQNIILCLGSFHMAKVALSCIGKYLKGSGAENIFVESGIFGVNVVESVLSGRNYTRSLKGIQFLKESMSRLQWSEFFKQNENTAKYQDVLDTLVQLKAKVVDKRRDETLHLVEELETSSHELLTAFEVFTSEAGEKSETYRYWDTFIRLVSKLENLIRSDREGNWELHLEAVQALLPIFSAFDSVNYLRWCSLYLEDMRKLPESAPEIHQAFKDGKFAVKRSPGHFKAVGADMALEQTINRSKKSSSGIIGSTRKKQYVAMWDIIYHEMLAISNLHRELSGVRSGYYQQNVNSSFSKSETEFGEKNVQAILTVIENNENPFQQASPRSKLHNIMTQQVMTEEIRDQLLKVDVIGTAGYEKLRRERLVDKTVRFSQPIHRTNLKTFITVQEKLKEDKSSGKLLRQRENKYQREMIEVARARGKTMRELMEYDLSSSCLLFDKDGLMTKANKSMLMIELEKHLTKDDPKVPDYDKPTKTAYIADVMANTRKISSKSFTTFGEFVKAIMEYLLRSSKKCDRLDLVFDSYQDLSIKDSERKRRETITPIEMNVVQNDTPLPVQMERFWPSNNNKYKLELLLSQQARLLAEEKPTNIQLFLSGFSGDSSLVPCFSCRNGSTTQVSELCLNIEEADSRIIPHALHAVEHEMERLVVLTPDTDVFVLLLYYWNTLHVKGLQELWLKAGVGDTTRYIPIHKLATRIGPNLCKVLPAVHTLTGCDYTSKMGTKPAALKANPSVNLEDFGTNIGGSLDEVIAKAEIFLVQILKKGTSFTTMNELRDHLYHHSKCVLLEQLPPTSHAVKAHILRAYYATHEMITLLTPSHVTLSPTSYGYSEEDEMLLPDTGIRPIPEEYAIRCNCLKCATDRWCPCRKNNLPCCLFCKCQIQDEKACCKNPAGQL